MNWWAGIVVRKSNVARERERKSRRRVWIFNEGLAPVSSSWSKLYPAISSAIHIRNPAGLTEETRTDEYFTDDVEILASILTKSRERDAEIPRDIAPFAIFFGKSEKTRVSANKMANKARRVYLARESNYTEARRLLLRDARDDHCSGSRDNICRRTRTCNYCNSVAFSREVETGNFKCHLSASLRCIWKIT